MKRKRSRAFELLAVVFAFGLASWAMAGTRASDSQGEETVRRVIQLGGISGWDDKELGRMGDAAAVDVAKFVGGDNLSEQQAGSVLAVLQLAFSSPKLVATPSDREPRAALFVLRYLEATAANAAVKQRVAEARSLILQNYEKYKANP